MIVIAELLPHARPGLAIHVLPGGSVYRGGDVELGQDGADLLLEGGDPFRVVGAFCARVSVKGEPILVGEDDDTVPVLVDGSQLGRDGAVPPFPVERIVAELLARGGSYQRGVEVEGGNFRPAIVLVRWLLCVAAAVVAPDEKSGRRVVVRGAFRPGNSGLVFLLGGWLEEVGDCAVWLTMSVSQTSSMAYSVGLREPGAPTGDGALDLALDGGRRDGGVVVIVGRGGALSLGGRHCADVPRQEEATVVAHATHVLQADKVDEIEAFPPAV